MPRSFQSDSGRKVLFFAVVFAIAAVIFFMPQTPSKAAKSNFSQTKIDEPILRNYDIRMDKKAIEKVATFRSDVRKSASEIADARDKMVIGEQRLKARIPSLKIEYNADLKIPEVIAPDVKKGRAFLTRTSDIRRSDILKNFIKDNEELVGTRARYVQNLKVAADYSNPNGKLSFVELNQEINGVPVFRGEIKAAFTRSREMIRVVNNLAPGLEEADLSTDFGDPADAVRSAAGHINKLIARTELTKNDSVSTDLKAVFGVSDTAPTAEKMYFPTEPGVAVPAWRVLISLPLSTFYIIVDAKTGTMLWRKNITDHQTQTATYNVYANPNAMINLADSPFPMTPGPTSMNGSQGAAISRSMITRVGNESPYTFNNLGWITDGNNTTDGNNVQAGLDREDPNNGSFNSNAIDPTGMATGSPDRFFDFPINPGIPTNPVQNTGDSPLPAGEFPQQCLPPGTNAVPTDFQKASVTQLFYITNLFHDEMYLLGFTEAARNFQHDNFGRGGLDGDRISAQAQDCSGINNANFTTPADGSRPQMQMYLWPGPNPDIDGSLDADVVIHELVHGVSNRLHGNSSGLFLDIARGMGEGWSDFYGHSMLSEPTDPLDGIYTTGAYDTYQFSSVGFNNYYYGIRRFPKAIMSSVGGPNNRPHNPLTFADIDSTQMNVSDGAFSPRFNATADQVHAIGEVWSSALWEIRALMIQRLGWEVGNRRALQIVTDGMKLAPIGPTPISERDAIIAGVFASGNEADLADVWAGFAIRGMGVSASIQNVGGLSTGGLGTIRVTEAFDLPNITLSPVLELSDSSGDNDGFPEPGETIVLPISLTNSTGNVATGVTLQVVGGGSASYGTMPGISTLTQQVSYIVPSDTACGSVVTLTMNVTSSLGETSFARTFEVGEPIVTFTENFDSITAPSIPSGWTITSSYEPMTFVSTTLSPDTGPNSMFAADLPNCSGGGCPTTNGGSTELTSPTFAVGAAAATVSFRHKFNTEAGWDGGVLEISIAGGEFQDILTAGGVFLQNGYNSSMGVSSPNPLGGRNGWTGNSGGYLTTIARMPSVANGQNIQLRWRFGTDSNSAPAGGGWNVDSIQFAGNYNCSLELPSNVSLSGRVLTPTGLSLRNAVVIMTDSQLISRRVTTGSFGIFQFDDVVTGQNYTISVNSKRYRFTAQMVNVTQALTGLDFVGLE